MRLDYELTFKIDEYYLNNIDKLLRSGDYKDLIDDYGIEYITDENRCVIMISFYFRDNIRLDSLLDGLREIAHNVSVNTGENIGLYFVRVGDD